MVQVSLDGWASISMLSRFSFQFGVPWIQLTEAYSEMT